MTISFNSIDDLPLLKIRVDAHPPALRPGLRDAFNKARTALLDAKNILVVGEPGAGKTYILDKLRQSLCSESTKVQAATPRPILFLDELSEMLTNMPFFQFNLRQKNRPFHDILFPDWPNEKVIAGSLCDSVLEKSFFANELINRLNMEVIKVPSLRESKDDASFLFEEFVNCFSEKYGLKTTPLSKEARTALAQLSWPANAHDVKRMAQQTLALSQSEERLILNLKNASPQNRISSYFRFESPLISERQLKKDYARHVNDFLGGKKSTTLEILGIDFKTLQKRLKR
ncbi:MAG: transcriptional regulator with AAA-type ATPase domain [Candidatus Marinamargulisbacteria bacterium]|jgi:transcriptional regulator with AAA-type ATPase domain